MRIVRPTLRFLCVAIAVGAAAPLAFACRYSVRDIGFVDDGDAAPAIVLSGPSDEVSEIESLLRGGAEKLGLKPRVIGENETSLSVALARGDARLPITVSPSDAAQVAESVLAQVTPSKFDRQLLRTSIDNPCAVLLIGGDRSAEADRAVREGVRRATDEAELWAKPMVGEPQVITLDRSAAEESRVLLWSLGVEDLDRPSALVVYGRLRRMGPVLTDERLNAGAVARTIGLLGKDCECDLDRGVFDGPGALHVWDEDLAAIAREALAFDPQHPMTELEVSQILAKKTNAGGAQLSDSDVFWGYEEVDLLSAVEAMPAPEEAVGQETRADPPSEQAEVQMSVVDPESDAAESFESRPGRSVEVLAIVGAATAVSALTGWFLLRRQAG